MAVKGQKEVTKTAETQAVKTETKYSKEQILDSAKFANRHDILNALLTDEKEYSIAEVNSVMDSWFKKGVK